MTPISPARENSVAELVVICVALLSLLGIASNFFQLHDFMLGLWEPGVSPVMTDRDFANYWMAGILIRSGEYQDLWLQSSYFPHLQAAFGHEYQIRNWGYPPHFLLLIWPLGFLPYKSALVVFLASTLSLFLWAVIEFRRSFAKDSRAGFLWLALPPYVAMMIVTAQNGFLTSALLLLGLASMRFHPVRAGLCFALLTIKPQLGFLIPLLLAFDRNWTTIGWAALGTLVLIAMSTLFFGLESWHSYLTETLAYQRSVMTDWYGIFLRMMPTVFGGARTLGLQPGTAFALQWPVSISAGALVVWVLWKEPDPLRRVFALATATFLISPYGFNYDMGTLAVSAALLLGSSRAPPGRGSQFAIGLVAVLPAVVMNLGRAGFPLAPAILLGALLATAMGAWRRKGAASAATPIPAS